MAASPGGGRKRPQIRAEGKAWERLAKLLRERREQLGYRYQTAFSRDRGLHIRMVRDIESALESRQNTYPPETLQQVARVYQVTLASLEGVLLGAADSLEPAPEPGPVPVPAAGGGPWAAPGADPARWARAAPYYDQIVGRLLDLAAAGITDPDGTAVFGAGSADAAAWDSVLGRRWPVRERAWMIADLQAREAGPGWPARPEQRGEQGTAG